MNLDVGLISQVLLPDGWHVIAAAPQSVTLDYDVSITDSGSGKTATPRGGAWVRLLCADASVIYCPVDNVLAVKHVP